MKETTIVIMFFYILFLRAEINFIDEKNKHIAKEANCVIKERIITLIKMAINDEGKK